LTYTTSGPPSTSRAATPAGPNTGARLFNGVVHEKLGVWPLFYSYPDFIARMKLAKTIGDGLWLSSYSRNDGTEHPYMVPRPWHKVAPHQFTSAGTLSGVKVRVDLSHTPHPIGSLLAHPLRGRL